jgi:hypothetical protein
MGRRQRQSMPEVLAASRAARSSVPHRSRPRRACRGLPHLRRPHHHGTALTRRGLAQLTRIGSRERGAGCGRRWTGSRTAGEPPHRRGSNESGTGWATPLEQGWVQLCSRWLPFSLAKSHLAPFFVVTWPPNLIIKDTFKGIAGPDSHEKLVPNIIDKYKLSYSLLASALAQLNFMSYDRRKVSIHISSITTCHKNHSDNLQEWP